MHRATLLLILLWPVVAAADPLPAPVSGGAASEPLRESASPAPGLAAAVTALREGERLLRGPAASRDPVAACHRFEEAAREALPQAWLRLGQCYAQGHGRASDKALAAGLYRKAAEAGMAAAQTAWALALQRGDGTERDEAAALSWFGRAAQAGDANAALALARAYEIGTGTSRDRGLAAKWMQHAADQRNPAAQLALAHWYLVGDLVERSPLLGYAWSQIAFESSMRLGDPAAAAHLMQRAGLVRAQSAMQLVADDLLEGQRLARQWQPGSIALRAADAARSAAPTAQGSAPGAPATTAPRPAAGTGSGFFVSREGHLVTNEHVVRDCREVRIAADRPVRVLAIDRAADLALLKAAPVERAAVLRADKPARQGEDVLIYGFPLHGVLSSSGQVGAGMITALSGLRDNPLQLQIDVPVQAGNSGGPLIDSRGEVIGVVVSKLNALKVAQVTGDIPQNVNFAVRSDLCRPLLAGQSLPRRGDSNSRDGAIDRAKAATVQILIRE